ncbi:MAG: hypothetical protein LBG16_01835, partial [Elusimicrobiota bacterium]|nr:hypothetical protein [Elusimicrobiota bacterium]
INGSTAGASWKTIDLEIDLTGCTITTTGWSVSDGQLNCIDNPYTSGSYSISSIPSESIFYDEHPYGNGDANLDYLLGLNYKTGRRWCSVTSAEDICMLLGGIKQSSNTLCGPHRTKCYAL